jgi:hypothetical protein
MKKRRMGRRVIRVIKFMVLPAFVVGTVEVRPAPQQILENLTTPLGTGQQQGGAPETVRCV